MNRLSMLASGLLVMAAGTATGEPTAPPSPSYRTLVVIGDTQSLAFPETVHILREQIDWIRAHKNDENIDFVLQVGDLIEDGNAANSGGYRTNCGPTRSECSGNIPDVGPHAACRLSPGEGIVSPLPCGCYVERPGPRGYSCAATGRDVDAQWKRIKSEFDRLTGEVPYAVTSGNHDNPSPATLGKQPKASAQPRGYTDYFPLALYRDQQERFKDSPHALRVLEESPAGEGSYALQFTLGTRQVLLVALADGGIAATLRRVAWAKEILTRYHDLPAIVLSHRYLWPPTQVPGASQIWDGLIQPVPGRPGPFAGQIFMTVSGHLDTDAKQILDIGGGHRLIQVWFDQQVNAPPVPPPVPTLPQAGYMAAIRFDLSGSKISSVTISATENKILPYAPDAIGGFAHFKNVPFTVPSPP